LIEPRALVTFGEILPSIMIKLIDFLHGFVLLFIQGLFSVLEQHS